MKLKRIARLAAIAFTAVVLVGIGLYLSGLRIVLDGGGGIHFAFPKPADERAEELARHRENQRALPPPAAASTAAAAESAPLAKPASEDPERAPASTHWTDFRGPARDGHYQQQPIRTD